MSNSVFVNGEWYDYDWLKAGCIDEMHFNWFYSLWTASNPDVKQLVKEGPFRKFVSSEGEFLLDDKDMVSHNKRFSLHNVDHDLFVKIKDTIYKV